MKDPKPLKRSQFKPKRKSDTEWVKARKLVLDRCDGYCEAQWEPCQRRADQVHHKLRRSQGGKHGLDNLLACCTPCHDAIHRNPEEAFSKGHLLRKNPENE